VRPAILIVIEKPQLEYTRCVERGNPQRRPGRSDGSACGYQTDELGGENGCPAQLGLRFDTRDDLVERGRLPVLDVHAHLDAARAGQVETERTDAGKPTAAFAHDLGDRESRLEVALDVDIEGDQRRPRADDDSACFRVEARRPVIRAELARGEAALELLGP